MNILFLTLGNVTDLSAHEIYPDLLRALHKNHYNIYVACGREKRKNLPTELCEECGIQVLRVRIGNITKTNLIEKGISTLTVEHCFRKAINRYWKHVKFDLIMYSTPPITLSSLIAYLKKRDHAKTYLMLKDIFPQNAVDLNMFGKKSPIYLYFRRRERFLYRISDHIGCMSPANVKYVTEHNPEVDPAKVEIFANALEIQPQQEVDITTIRKAHGIPEDKLVFLFGGNLGKPQGIDFLITCLQKQRHRDDIFFVIAGFGTEYEKLRDSIIKEGLKNVLLLERMSSKAYNELTAACDVGLIFLDYRFTIPNFPSRILPYMQEGKPILAATDEASDLKETIESGGFGWWCPSNDVDAFDRQIAAILSHKEQLPEYGANGRNYLQTHYDVKQCVQTISKQLTKKALIISQCFYPSINRGGPAVSVTNLATALSSYMDISVLTTFFESGTNQPYTEVHNGKNRVFDCDVYYLKNETPKNIHTTMRHISPDTLYISSLFSAKYTLPALRYVKKHHIPAVLAPRGELQAEAINRKKLKKMPYIAYLKLCGLLKDVCFHATCEEEAQRIKKYFPKAKVSIAQNLPRQIASRARSNPKTTGKLHAVAVCRIHPIKGLAHAIAALSKVERQVQYDIYGPIEDEGYYQHCLTLVKQLPANCTVRFCGAVHSEELPQILSEADVFLLPTRTENFGNAIVEAMLCGCPPIISNGTPWKALFTHTAGENADDLSDYAASITRFADMDEAQWTKFSQGTAAYIRERLKIQQTVDTYLRMLGGTDETSSCTD